jgi:hypothetical protein
MPYVILPNAFIHSDFIGRKYPLFDLLEKVLGSGFWVQGFGLWLIASGHWFLAACICAGQQQEASNQQPA